MAAPAASEGPANDVARELIFSSANRGEALFSAIRAVFCGVVLLRLIVLGEYRTEGGGLSRLKFELPVLLAGAFLSCGAFVFARARRFTPDLLAVSTLLDAAFCFASLLSNVLWPPPAYEGLLRMPDVGVLLPLVFASALRLTPRAALASGIGNFSSLGVLVLVDRRLNGARLSYGSEQVGFLAILILLAAGVAWATTTVARGLAVRAAVEAARVDRARRRLSLLLQEHHDVRTVLSSAQLHLDLLARQSLARTAQDTERLELVRRAVSSLSEFVESVKSRVFQELAVIDGAAEVDVAAVTITAIDAVRDLFPQRKIKLSQSATSARARMVGGERALAHVLFNLMVNACEGNAAGHAEEVTVRVTGAEPPGEKAVRVEICDDGPGFPEAVIAAPKNVVLSSKERGNGLGISLAFAVVESSGGQVELANQTPRGGRVLLQFPAPC
jgi:signal transduction histidine kinase